MTQIITLKVDSKYDSLVKDDMRIQKNTGEFFEDYFDELNQDNITKKKLDSNNYDKKFNSMIGKNLGI